MHLDKDPCEVAKVNDKVCIKIDLIPSEINSKKVIYKVDFDETYQISTYMNKEEQKIYSVFKNDIESK